MELTVLLPYRFTLFSNTLDEYKIKISVLLPYRFTLFSNNMRSILVLKQFYYLIDLHYSQTQLFAQHRAYRFYYLIDLHYSQTQPNI